MTPAAKRYGQRSAAQAPPFSGKQIRKQPPGTAYNIPPNSSTPHCNINTSGEQVKYLYFSVRKDIDGTEL